MIPDKRHVPHLINAQTGAQMCHICVQAWPCDVEFSFQRHVNRSLLASLRHRIFERHPELRMRQLSTVQDRRSYRQSSPSL